MSKSQTPTRPNKPEASQAKGLVNKLVEILAELGPMEKKSRNPHFGYNYVGEGQVMAELRHRLASRQVFLFTSVETCVPHYGEGKLGTYVAVTTKHTFFDADSKEQFVVNGAGVGWDSGDKGVYKAITGAMKYALMKNFLVTDEQDPEADEQAPAPTKPGTTGHRRTRPYEEETGDGDAKATADLLELKAFLTKNKIPDGFLLTLLTEKKLIDGHTKNVAQLKPGILLRVLAPKSLENLVTAWQLHQEQEAADADSGSATPPPAKAPPYKKGIQNEEGDASKDEVRTNEGDQTRNPTRKQVTDDVEPTELLEQEGFTNWRKVPIHFGAKEGTLLGKLSAKDLSWWINNWTAKPYKGTWESDTLLLDAALVLASKELANE